MEEPVPRKEVKPADSAMFDVPAWLCDLTGIRDWQVSRGFARRKVESVTDYLTPQGALAQVTMRAVTSAKSASWELRADLGDTQAGIVIPGRTRIKW